MQKYALKIWIQFSLFIFPYYLASIDRLSSYKIRAYTIQYSIFEIFFKKPKIKLKGSITFFLYSWKINEVLWNAYCVLFSKIKMASFYMQSMLTNLFRILPVPVTRTSATLLHFSGHFQSNPPFCFLRIHTRLYIKIMGKYASVCTMVVYLIIKKIK